MYLALYRKYRPQNFDEVIGQDHIIKTLKNQILMDKVGHAYLFCGSRGTGKTSTAKIFAKEINCICGGKGTCDFCLNKSSLDILEIDAASNNGVDEIRDLREKVKYPPVDGKYKVYIIDEVHMLSPSAFNALLKTLEEPPKHAVFILATTEVHKLPATILSRCMRFDFKLVSVEDLNALLKNILDAEGISYDEQSIGLIARAGEGSVRDTLSIADRCISFAGSLTSSSVVEVLGSTNRQTLIEISNQVLSGNVQGAIICLDKILSSGKSPAVLGKDLVYYFRDLLIINILKEKASSMIIASPEDLNAMQTQATDQNYYKITKAIELLSSVEAELRYSAAPRIVLENCIIKMLVQDSLAERVERLEKALADGVGVNMVSPAPVVAPRVTSPDPVQRSENTSTNNVAESAKQTTPAAEVNKPSSGEKLLGELLNYLRQQKLMSLLMACRQISKVVIEGKVAKFSIRDQASINMIKTEKYSKIISAYLDNYGLSWQIVTITGGGNLNELSQKLGGKLEIR